MTEYVSPLLALPGAVPAERPDAGTAWHYGDPLREQRLAATAGALLDLSHRDVLLVPGPDRLSWLHAICSQHVRDLADGEGGQALVLSPQGHVEQHWELTELDGTVWIDTEPGAGGSVLAYLDKMRFLKQVDPQLVTASFARLSLYGPGAGEILTTAGLPLPSVHPSEVGRPYRSVAVPAAAGFVRAHPDGSFDLLVSRSELVAIAGRLRGAGAHPMGSWAASARRVEQRVPRLGMDTDHRTIPQEVGWIGSAVHLDKGCYRGQETVARVQNLGRPPRRMVLLHLAGESDELPPPGTPVRRVDRVLGFFGTAVHHHELGPVALAVLKRSVVGGEPLEVGGHAAVVDDDEPDFTPVPGFAGRVGPAQTSA